MSHTIDNNITHHVLDLAKKRTQAAEVFHIRSEDTQVEFKADELKEIYTRYTDGIGLRVIKEGKLGFSSTTDSAQLNSLVDKAFNSAQFGQEAKFQFPTAKHDHTSSSSVATYDPAIAQYTVDAMVASGKRLVQFIKEKEPETKCDAGITKRVARVELTNTTGNHIHYQKTIYSEYINSFTVESDGFLWVDESIYSGQLAHLSDEILNRLISKLQSAKKKAKVETKLMPVVFVPKALYSILIGLELGCNGKYIQKGTSPLTGKLGQSLFSPELTIVDDPTIAYGVNSAPYDDEGIVHRPLTFIDEGELEHFIYDLQTAGLMQVHSTGHGHRGFSSLPAPDFSNLIIQSGNVPFQKMIAEIPECIIVHQLLGSGQSNLLAGDFSLNVDLGYKIENGQIIGRIKDTMVSGNTYDALGHIAGLSQEVETSGNLTTPWVLFERLNITSAAE